MIVSILPVLSKLVGCLMIERFEAIATASTSALNRLGKPCLPILRAAILRHIMICDQIVAHLRDGDTLDDCSELYKQFEHDVRIVGTYSKG
jgi:hypothetical protein